eukprot:COSAG06_NODE_3293_length_5545_cov_27.493573_2_plen_89_part_00
MTQSALEANRAVALSATLMHTERGNSMHTNGIAACIARDRERETDPKQWVSALEQETYALSSTDTHTHTHPTSPAAEKPASQPCGRVR